MATRLVGRARELAVLDERFGRPATASAAIEVVGDAGMGKTTLLEAAAERATASGHLVARLTVTEVEQTLPWAGIGSLHPSLPGAALEGLSDVHRMALDAALGDGRPRLATTGPYVAAALRNVLRWTVADTPLLVAIDDLHWLDAASAGALAVAIRGCADLPLTVVAARRSAVPVPVEFDRLVAHDHRLLDLAPFDDAEVHELLRRRLGPSLTGPLLARVARLSGGNPLYTVLLGEQATHDTGQVPLPGSIVGSYVRRLDELPNSVVEVLEHAGVLGRPDVALLQRACPDIDVPGALLAAERAGLISGPADGLQFVHPLLPTALVERLGSLGRERIHRRLAEVVEDPESRAVHLAAASVAPDPDVAATIESAASSALARGARIEAGRMFERAAALTPVDAVEDRWRRALAAADAYVGGGDVDRAAEQGALAVDLATGPVELAIAGGVMVNVVANRSGLHPAHDLVTRLLADVDGQPLLRATLARAKARIEQTFDFSSALETAERSVRELREAGEDGAAAVAEVVAENCRFVLGLPTDPLAAWAVVEPDADPTNYAGPAWMAAEMLVWDHQLAAAEAALNVLEQRADAGGNMLVEFKVHEYRANLESRRGDLAAAERELRRAVDCAELTGYPASMASYGLARVMAATGRPREAATLLDALEAPSEDLPLLHVARSNGLGALAVAEGRWDDAVEHLQHAWSSAEKVGMGDLRALPFRGDLVEALVRVGRVDDAADATARIDELAERCGAPTAHLHAGRARLHVLVGEGRLEEAVALGERLHQTALELAMPIERCRVGHLLGTAQRRLGRRRDAGVTLADARAEAESLDLVMLVERIDEELARLGARRDPMALTATEEQVAALVASGRSNREVASELVVSLRTVESNLTRIYRKLGIRSRSELAAGYRTSRGADLV